MLDASEREALLALARESVRAAAEGRPGPAAPGGPAGGIGGAFVTLKRGGVLRGCIGTFSPSGGLAATVADMAARAAVEDPRFPPVAPGEVDEIRIDISVLSALERSEPGRVVPGLHGVLVRRGWRTGTLLPQVATEEGWDRDTLLAHVCLKAGLPEDSWRRGELELFTYTAEVFGDHGGEGSDG